MSTLVRILIAAMLVLALLAFMMAYTVRFTEAAVVTTFGKASENAVKTEPGLYFKWFPPIQNVTKYDTRTRVLQLRVETQQTKDNRQVAVETLCTWRVNNPLKFFQIFSNEGDRPEQHYQAAERALSASLRAAASAVSGFTMDELFTTNAGGSKLPELEARMLAAFREASNQKGGKLDDYGIAAEQVAVTRVLLPDEVTKAVFERMKAGRERIAKEIESQGQSQAQAIRDKAMSDAGRITAFADQLAQNIRAKGDSEATEFYRAMQENPDLAVFLSNMEFIRSINP